MMRPGERPLRAALDPFSAALADPTTTEVVVNQPGEFGVEAAGRWTWHDAPDLTYDRLDRIGILAASMSGKDVDAAHPLAEASLPNGERIHICRPAATSSGIISLTIRRPSAHARTIDDPDFDALFEEANIPSARKIEQDAHLVELKRAGDWRGLFRAAVKGRKTIGVTGSTGSGKTDLLRRLMQEVDERERIITIEDASEFGKMRQRNRVALFHSSGSASLANLTAEDLVKTALRMRPDRIMIQEVRAGDAFAFIRVVAAGHPGSVTTWHAEEGEAFDALELMVKQHPAGNAIPDAKVRAYLMRHLDIVVWCSKDIDRFSAPNVWLKAEQQAA